MPDQPEYQQHELDERADDQRPGQAVNPCACRCGYRCDGPESEITGCSTCELDLLDCIEQHYVRDCHHRWDGPMVTHHAECSATSVTCSVCGMSALAHDMMVGP